MRNWLEIGEYYLFLFSLRPLADISILCANASNALA